MYKLYLIITHILKRELAINITRQSEWLAVLLFYVMVISLFPIAMGPMMHEIIIVAPAVIWVAVLLTTFVAQESMLRCDFNIGIFEQMLLSDYPFSLLILVKILVHWLIFAVPMILLTPILALSLSVPLPSIAVIMLSLVLGTLILFLVGAIGAALTISLARGGVLLAILILPLYAPVLILGTNIGMLSLDGIIDTGQLALLGALAVAALLGAPLAVAAAIRVSIE
jgi:heme exporter protein B